MPKILKLIATLHSKKGREKEGKIILEGLRSVEELLKLTYVNFYIIYTKEILNSRRGQNLLDQITRRNIEKILVTARELEKCSTCETPPGILAIVDTRRYTWETILSRKNPFLIVLDGIQDPGNLGTIIRTAEAAGVTGVIITKGTVDIYNPKVVRATMGSILRLPILKAENILEVIRKLKENQIRIIACDIRGEKFYYQIDWRLPLAVLFGNEGAGLGAAVLEHSDEIVKIPQRHNVDSINVAVASGIIMYQVVEKAKNR